MQHLKLKTTLLLILTASCSSSCSNNGAPDTRPAQGQILSTTGFEMAPVHFMDVDMLLVFERDPHEATDISARKISFYNMDFERITEFKYDLAFSSAVVVGDTLYVFGSTLDGQKNKAYATTDLEHWSDLGTMLSATNEKFYNTSVIFDGTQWIMAYENITHNGTFTSHIAIANDLNSGFFRIGNPVRANGIYTACPMIRKVGEYYYVIYLSLELWDDLESRVSRTKDFISWEQGSVLFKAGYAEGRNFSDVDMLETTEGLKVFYMDGDQVTWMNLKTLTLSTTIKGLMESGFN